MYEKEDILFRTNQIFQGGVVLPTYTQKHGDG